jgi:hypothetical protein
MGGLSGDRNCYHVDDGAFMEYPEAEGGFLLITVCNFMLT